MDLEINENNENNKNTITEDTIKVIEETLEDSEFNLENVCSNDLKSVPRDTPIVKACKKIGEMSPEVQQQILNHLKTINLKKRLALQKRGQKQKEVSKAGPSSIKSTIKAAKMNTTRTKIDDNYILNKHKNNLAERQLNKVRSKYVGGVKNLPTSSNFLNQTNSPIINEGVKPTVNLQIRNDPPIINPAIQPFLNSLADRDQVFHNINYQPTRQSLDVDLEKILEARRNELRDILPVIDPYLPHSLVISVINNDNYLNTNNQVLDVVNVPVQEQHINPNMAEIITSVLQDVIKNERIGIDSVIGKIRMLYEESINADNKSVILLNFENDTFVPVLKINDNMLEIIDNWYEMADLLIDFEETGLSIPANILTEELTQILCNPIDCNIKDTFIKEHIPIFINYLLAQNEFNKIKNVFKENVNVNVNGLEEVLKDKRNKIIDEYKIVLPEGLIYKDDYFYKDNDKYIVYKEGTNKPVIKEEIIPLIIPKPKPNPLELGYDAFETNNYFEDEVTKTWNIKPYNSYQSCLYSSAFDCYQTFSELPQVDKINEVTKQQKQNVVYSTLIVVLYNYIFGQTIVLIDPHKDELDVMMNNCEYGFIELFTIQSSNQDILEHINKKYANKSFETVEELNELLVTTGETIDFINQHSKSTNTLASEEKNIKDYFIKTYIIDTDLNHRMKASVLYDMIVDEPSLNKFIEQSKLTSFKNRLSKYLKELGLQKKRYNDGYYYYGIRCK